jgi:hypothetical protein
MDKNIFNNEAESGEKRKNLVGKKAEPGAEELEFIYGLLDNNSDAEVLEEMKKEEFPVRSPGFIKRRRKEFGAAKKVLEQTLKKSIDPVIAKMKARHFIEMADMASVLITNELDTVIKFESDKQGDNAITPKIEYWWGEYEERRQIDTAAMSELLNDNLEALNHISHPYKVQCLLTHLKAEFPDAKKGSNIFSFKENSYKFIEHCRILVEGKIFIGACPVCEDWGITFDKTEKARIKDELSGR